MAPAAKPVPPAYKRLASHFAFYAEYHDNVVNQWIHIVCVPLILLTALVFFSYIDLASALSPSAHAALAGALKGTRIPLDGALPLAVAYAAYYLYLTPSPLGVAAAAMVGGLFAGAHAWVRHFGAPAAWQPAVALHVVCWIAQFYGHGVHERRAPALLDNLWQALFMAPIFVLIEAGLKVGALRDFHAAVAPDVARRIAAHKAHAAGGSGAAPPSSGSRGRAKAH
jgi:2-hydroxy fatty acid dioxygenase